MKISKRFLTLVGVASCAALMASACGGEENECADNQTFASINGGAEQCYDQCVNGMCADGFSCSSGLCIAGGANNTTNNTTANNTTANNTTANNTTANNTANNTTPSNNTTPTNNETCDTPVNLGTCEPLCQTGCADNEACVVGSAGPGAGLVAACQPAGAGGAGATCDQMNGCQAGFVCNVTEQGAASGTCTELCAPGGAACATAGATCAPINQEMTLGLCVVPMDECDPLNDMCPAGEVCAPTTVGNQCITGGGKALGETCNAQALECDKGLYCVDIGQGPICRALCNPQNSMCTAPAQCNAFQGQTDLGVCI